MRKPIRDIKSDKLMRRVRRKLSIRKKIIGTSERPRVCVVKSNKNISILAVDDSIGKTLLACNSFGKSKIDGAKKSKEGAAILGKTMGQKLKDMNINQIVFDRAGHKYHGVVSSMADGIREMGIKF